MLTNISVGSRVGKGNFGEVYRGTWEGSLVALKKVTQGQADEFKREASLLWYLKFSYFSHFF